MRPPPDSVAQPRRSRTRATLATKVFFRGFTVLRTESVACSVLLRHIFRRPVTVPPGPAYDLWLSLCVGVRLTSGTYHHPYVRVIYLDVHRQLTVLAGVASKAFD